jgi:hypothetical protein
VLLLRRIQDILISSHEQLPFVVLQTYRWLEFDNVVRMPVVCLEDNFLVASGAVSYHPATHIFNKLIYNDIRL